MYWMFAVTQLVMLVEGHDVVGMIGILVVAGSDGFGGEAKLTCMTYALGRHKHPRDSLVERSGC